MSRRPVSSGGGNGGSSGSPSSTSSSSIPPSTSSSMKPASYQGNNTSYGSSSTYGQQQQQQQYGGGSSYAAQSASASASAGAVRPGSAKNPGSLAKPRPALHREWIYGYRGARARNNLFHLASGALVYHTAAVGVVLDVRNGTQRIFSGYHDDDIISLAVHPDGVTVATGQIGVIPRICIWHSESLECLSIIRGFHESGVCALTFDIEGSKLFSVGLDANSCVAVWNWKSGHQLMDGKGHGDRIFEVQYNNVGNCAVTVGVKHVAFWTFKNNILKKNKGEFGNVGPVQTMLAVMFGSRTGFTYTGSLAGDIYEWNDKYALTRVFAGLHSGPIFALWEHDAGFITSGRDARLCSWDKNFKPVGTYDLGACGLDIGGGVAPCPRAMSRDNKGKIALGLKTGEIIEVDLQSNKTQMLHASHDEGEIWGLATHPSKYEFATASDDRTVRIWDMKNHFMLRCKTMPSEARTVDYSADGLTLAVGLANGTVAILDSGSLQAIRELNWKKQGEPITQVRFSPDGQSLAVACRDQFIDVFDVRNQYKGAPSTLKGHSAAITSLDWGTDSRTLRSCSEDFEIIFWDVPARKRLAGLKDAEWNPQKRAMVWATWTGVLGDTVDGIWPPESDKADVNATALDKNQTTLVTADDYGYVKLFSWPPSNPGARHSKFSGHAAHVTNVRFSFDDRYVISTGGADQTVIQWAFTRDGGESVTESDNELDMDLEQLDSDLERELARPPDLKICENERKLTKKLVEAQERLASKRKQKAAGVAVSDEEEDVRETIALETKLEALKARNSQITVNPVDQTTRHAQESYLELQIAEAATATAALEKKAQENQAAAAAAAANAAAAAAVAAASVSAAAAGAKIGGPSAGAVAAPVAASSAIVPSVSAAPTGAKANTGAIGANGTAITAPGKPKVKKAKKSTKAVGERPKERLVLDYVHGYRGSDTRDNLFYNCDGKIVYHAAAVGIVFDPVNNKQEYFYGHDDDIVCLAMCPKRQLVATGQIGREPIVCIWDSTKLEARGILKGFHKVAVSAVTFSPDGVYLATVGRDLQNSIAVYNWDKGYLVAFAPGHSEPILGVEWNPTNSSLFATCGVRHITFWNVLGNTLDKGKGIFGNAGKVSTVLSVAYEEKTKDGTCYCGTSSGDVLKFRDRKLVETIKNCHAGVVYSIQPFKDGYVSGGKDGFIRVWNRNFQKTSEFQIKDPDYGKPLIIRSVDSERGKVLVGTQDSHIFEIELSTGKINLRMQGHALGEVWGLAMHPNDMRYITASDDHSVRLWDIKGRRLLKKFDTGKVARCVAFSPDAKEFAVGFKNGAVAVYKADWNQSAPAEVAIFRHRKEMINCLAYSPDGRTLAVGSAESFVDLYKVADPATPRTQQAEVYKRYAICKGHAASITNMDWSVDSKFLQTDSAAGDHKFWFASNGTQVTKKEAMGEVQWKTYTCTMGEPVAGIWPAYSEFLDINAACRNNAGTLLTTSDDFGFVKLFKYPADDTPRQVYKKFDGHAAHVTCTRFSIDDKYVVTTGGHDQCVFQWRIELDTRKDDGSGNEFSDQDENIAAVIAEPPPPKAERAKSGPSVEQIAKFSLPQADLVEQQGVKAQIAGGEKSAAAVAGTAAAAGLQGGKPGVAAAVAGGKAAAGGPAAAGAVASGSARPGTTAAAVAVTPAAAATQAASAVISRKIDGIAGGLPKPNPSSLTVYQNPKDQMAALKAQPARNVIVRARPGRRENQRNFNAPAAGGAGGAQQAAPGTAKPSARLELEFVYGARCYDCYNNIYYNARGEVVYHAAGVGVVYDKKSHTQRHYTGHTDDILCLSMHPQGQLVATGEIGKNPKIVVWSSTDCSEFAVLKNQHMRAVTCLAFNREGSRLASVGLDDDHTVVVWKWSTSDVIAREKGHSDKIISVSWANNDEYLVTTGVKHIKFWFLLGNQLVGKKGTFGAEGDIQTVIDTCFSKDNKCYTGMASGAIYEWVDISDKGRTKPDFKCNRVVVPESPETHQGPLFGLCEYRNGYATGGKDSKIMYWDANWKPLTTLKIESGTCVRSLAAGPGNSLIVGLKHSEIIEANEKSFTSLLVGHDEGELWGLATHPKRPFFASASDDKTLRVWDAKARRPVKAIDAGKPARCLTYSPDGDYIAVGFNDGSWACYNASTLQMVGSVRKHCREWISDIKYSPDGSKVAVGSHDNFVDVYAVKENFKRIARCKGHTSFITHLDWSDDSQFLQTECGAHEHLYWQADNGKQITKSSSMQGCEWASWTCVLGYPVSGIWPAGADNTDINTSDRSSNGSLLATGDDFGHVKVFAWPPIGPCPKVAPFDQYVGHSSHVTKVAFTSDDSYLITAGGNDMCLFQWRVSGGGGGGSAGGGAGSRPQSAMGGSRDSYDNDYGSPQQQQVQSRGMGSSSGGGGSRRY